MAVYQVSSSVLISRLVDHLKKRVKDVSPPEWAPFVKTGVQAEKRPEDPDWWYVRCASILRKLYLKGPIGVSRLRVEYGGKQRTGSKPPYFRRSGGSIIRHALQQLEKAGLVETVGKKGRSLTREGRALVNKTALRIIKGKAR